MQVIDVVNFRNLLNPRLYLLNIDAFRRLLHENGVAVLCDLDGRREYNYREHECQDRVKDLVLGIVVDN